MVLDLTCDDLHRPAAYRFVEVITFNTAKIQHFSCDSKFYPSIWGDFQPKFDELMFSTSSLLTLGRTHASMVLHSLNRSL